MFLGARKSVVMAAGSSPAHGSTAIDHVVVLMLENRSFDQMLGLLPGVNGVTLDADGADPAHVNYLDPQNPAPEEAFPVAEAQYFGIPEGDIPPPQQLNGIATDLYGGPSHSFPSATQQLYNDAWGPARQRRQAAPRRATGQWLRARATPRS